MTFYQNFADGIHIKEEKIDIKRLYEIQDKFENIRYTKTLFFVKPGKNLLEIGAGRGGFARLCKDKQINYFGIEPEYTLFKKLKEEGFSVENSKVPPISHKTGFFDYVTHFHVIEHLKDGEEVYKFFVEINRVLQADGKMLFRCPNVKTWGFDFWDVDYTHSFFTSPRRINQILYDSGFKTVHFEEFSFLKPYHFGNLARILSKIKVLDNIYPRISYLLGKVWKKNTELFYICEKK